MKNLRKIVAAFLTSAALVTFHAGCGVDSEGYIEIGATIDLTGPNTTYGEQVKEGLDLAVEEINAAGGVGGKSLRILLQDSKSNPSEAVSNANRFISVHRVQVIIGEIASNATLALVPVAESNKVFLFAPASSSPELTHISKYFARNWPASDGEAGVAAEAAHSVRGHRTAVVIYVNSYYGIGLKDTFVEEFKSQGGQMLREEPYELDEVNFRPLLLRVRAAAPEVIYLAGNPRELGRAISQIRELGMATEVFANVGFIQRDCLEIAGAAAEGVIVPVADYNPQEKTEGTISRFYQNFKDRYAKEPTFVNANGYDAIYLIAGAIREAGYDGTAIAENIRNKKNFEGAAGMVSFTEGEVEVPIRLKIIRNGAAENFEP